MFKKLRDPVSGLTHLGAAVAAVFGLVFLLVTGGNSLPLQISLTVYGISLILLYAASATYHLVKANPHAQKVLRTLDHSAIYLVIAGTYTPICMYFFRGFWQWGLLGIIWMSAIVGISAKVFILNAPRWLTAGIYLLMGWLSVMAIGEMIATMPVGALVWLVLGGVCFTLGAVIYITKKMDFYPGVFGFHEVWHIFVILGSACHFIVIAAFIAAPTLAL